jgi:mannan endo-1,4-beta-mannosidase
MHQGSFVARSGSKLLLDDKPFRFSGPNIYWLGLDENVDGVQWPTEFRVRNALDTAVEMGATVVRSHTLASSQGCAKAIWPERGVCNEEALRKVDFAVKEAASRNLRLIIPFVCNWSYYHGGRETFTAWRGLENPDDFYTNPLVIGDFKVYISCILNRINHYTGVSYKEDPTILAWELGNELNGAPKQWVAEIADFIKSIDANHLVAHGKQFEVDEDKLSVDSLDILDVHYYPADASKLVNDSETVKKAGKVFIAGEYGWQQCDLAAFLVAAETNRVVSGTLFWSLFGHHDNCGYVQHYDGFAVHYPGNHFNGDLADKIPQMRRHAYAMTEREVPEPGIPAAPIIKYATRSIAFQGVVGGAYYTVEKSVNGEQGPWNTLYFMRPADHDMPWIDPSRAHNTRTWYRVRAYNSGQREGVCSAIFESAPFTL